MLRNRKLFEPRFVGREQSAVAFENHSVFVNHNRLVDSPPLHERSERGDLRLGMRARIFRVRNDLAERPAFSL